MILSATEPAFGLVGKKAGMVMALVNGSKNVKIRFLTDNAGGPACGGIARFIVMRKVQEIRLRNFYHGFSADFLMRGVFSPAVCGIISKKLLNVG